MFWTKSGHKQNVWVSRHSTPLPVANVDLWSAWQWQILHGHTGSNEMALQLCVALKIMVLLLVERERKGPSQLEIEN